SCHAVDIIGHGVPGAVFELNPYVWHKISVNFAYSLIGFSACSVLYFYFVSNAELLLNTVLSNRNYFLNVSVAQANNVANIRFRISPWIEDGIGARERRILMIARG